MTAHVRTILNNQETIADLDDSKHAKASARATKVAHSALVGNLLRFADLMILLPLNAPAGLINFAEFLKHIFVLWQKLDPRERPEKTNVIRA